MTVCGKCNGTGEITVPVEEHLGRVLYGNEQCDECNGTGEVRMTEPKLKPCPFCGCTSISMFEHIDYGGTFYVMCDSCGAKLGTALDNIALTEEEITELWNKRVVAE